eukprot:137254-Rhodomonas_salina.1
MLCCRNSCSLRSFHHDDVRVICERWLHGAERAVDDHQTPLLPAGAAAAASKMLKIWHEGWWMVQSTVRAEAEMRLTDGITTRAER